MVLKIHDAYKIITSALEGCYDTRENRNIALIIMGISSIDLISNPDKEIEINDLEGKIKRLLLHEPVQYIVGHETFYGRSFMVNPSTLIPRPETEELVQLIIKDLKSNLSDKNYSSEKPLRILDIGTGSGAIGITLALELDNCSVEAWDISQSALDIATQNADRLGARNITFSKIDILNHQEVWAHMTQKATQSGTSNDYQSSSNYFDIVVSNPPYITPKEKVLMRDNVTNHEPHSALFVPEDDPLLFYRSIADLCLNNSDTCTGSILSSDGGDLYFEINEAYPNECCELLEHRGFTGVKCRDDLFGKPRMVYGYMPSKQKQ